MKQDHTSQHPIRSLQTMLRLLQLEHHQPCTVIADGVYGAKTLSAVSDFQQLHHLPVTGITDKTTWDQIVSDYEAAAVNLRKACPLQICLNPGERICIGSKHPYVLLVQSVLTTIQHQFHCIGCLELTGIWDEHTSEAIASFQKIAGLTETGELDKQTWKHLAMLLPLAASRCIADMTQ